MAGTLGRLALELGVSNKELIGGLAEGDAAVGSFEKKASGGMAGVGKSIATLGLVGAVGLLAVGGASVKMAGDFQSSTTKLVTGAGESQSAIGMVRQGLLDMSVQVGTSAGKLSEGMYLVESAGFHGAQGLLVMKAAAEGAKVGGADMAVVADGLTTVLNAYKMPATEAARVTSELVATVAAGKMHMEDLTASLGAILPTAAALHVPLVQVTGAIATMTSQGTNAATATQSLRFLMASMAGPTSAAAKEFAGLGIGLKDIPGITKSVSKELADLGLHTSAVAAKLASGDFPGAMAMITDAIGKKFPAGSAQYEAALKAAVGGTRGMTAALELTGSHAATWAANMGSISKAARDGGKDVQGWSTIQGDFNQKLDVLKAAAERAGIELGTKLLPVATQLAVSALPPLVAAAGFLTDHLKTIVPIVGAVVAGFVLWKAIMIAHAIATGLVTVATTAWTVATTIWKVAMIASAVITGIATGQVSALAAAQWLLNLAMDANPVGAIVIGIMLLVGVLVLAWTHIKLVRDVVGWLWQEIQILWHWIVGGSPGLVPAFQALISIISTVISIALLPMKIEFMLLSAAVGVVWNILQGVGGWLVSTFGGIISGVVGTIGNVVSSILSEFGKLPGQLVAIGGQIIDGLISGLLGGIGKIAGAVGSVAGSVVSGFKGMLGIKSPSSVMALQVGEPIMAGVAAGMRRSTAVGQAMKSQLGQLQGQLGGGQNSGWQGGGNQGGGARGGPVQQIVNNYFQAKIDPREGRQMGRDIAWQLKTGAG
jgi:TP901 family phage tail tape measure protein